jgi:hypothetical protein
LSADRKPKVRDRVARGAALLDEKRPGWAAEIDLDDLEMGSCFSCVLGQLFGEFADGADELFPDDWVASEEDVRHGFDAPANLASWEANGLYESMDAAWSLEIRRRTNGDHP